MEESDQLFDQGLEMEQGRLIARRREVEARIKELENELESVIRRLGHVQALLRDGGAPVEGSEILTPAADSETVSDNDPVELALAVLEERGGEPLHYRELAELVMQRGGHLVGQDPAQTLVSRLVGDDRFVRPIRRGWYALRVNYPTAKSVGKRKATAHKSASRQRAGRTRR